MSATTVDVREETSRVRVSEELLDDCCFDALGTLRAIEHAREMKRRFPAGSLYWSLPSRQRNDPLAIGAAS